MAGGGRSRTGGYSKTVSAWSSVPFWIWCDFFSKLLACLQRFFASLKILIASSQALGDAKAWQTAPITVDLLQLQLFDAVSCCLCPPTCELQDGVSSSFRQSCIRKSCIEGLLKKGGCFRLTSHLTIFQTQKSTSWSTFSAPSADHFFTKVSQTTATASNPDSSTVLPGCGAGILWPSRIQKERNLQQDSG